MKVRGVLLTSLLLVLILSAAGCDSDAQQGGAIHASGFVSGRTYVVVSPTGGSVSEVGVQVGDEVARGQVLVLLDDSAYLQLQKQALAGVDAAEVGLRTVEEIPLENEVERGEAMVSISQAELDAAMASLDLLESIYFPQDPPDSELHEAESAVAVAQAGLALARASQEQIMAGPLEGERAMAEALLKEAHAQLDLVEMHIEQLSVRSPSSGIVEELLVRAGETVAPGMPVARVLDPTFISVKVYVPEERVAMLDVGDEVELSADAFPDQVFRGSLLRIADRAQFTPTLVLTEEERVKLVFEVEVLIEGGLGELKPGMPVDVVIPEESN